MSKKLKDIVVITGKYTNRDGVEKNRYKTIGAVFETSKGQRMKIDSIPLAEGGWNGWADLYDPKPTDSEPRSRREESDDAPF